MPHFLGFSRLDFRGAGVEATDFVVFFVGEDGGGEGRVLGFGHLVFGDGGEWREGGERVGMEGCDLEI